MGLLEKILQSILNESSNDSDKQNRHDYAVKNKHIDDNTHNKIFLETSSDDFGYDFILNNNENKIININNNDIIIFEDNYINMNYDAIDIDEFIEEHRLLNSSGANREVKNNYNDYLIYLYNLLDKLDLKDNNDDCNYRDKDKEQIKAEEEIKQVKRDLITRIILLFKKKKEVWDKRTSERNLNREKGGHVRDYELEAKLEKIKVNKKKWKKKREEEMKRLEKSFNGIKNFVNFSKRIRNKIKLLQRIIGRKIAKKILITLSRGNKLSLKKINFLIKKFTKIKKKYKKKDKKILHRINIKKIIEQRKQQEEEILKVKMSEIEKNKQIELRNNKNIEKSKIKSAIRSM